jgi:hypothetical protein
MRGKKLSTYYFGVSILDAYLARFVRSAKVLS